MAAKTHYSVVIVSYNNYDNCTGPCLQSLLQDPADMEIIVVDNNSDSYTKSCLTELSRNESRIQLLLNSSNRGYAGGNNDGVALAKSDIVILLNNDTLIPIGSMSRLAKLFSNYPDQDMIGPVTNSCGNEQQIHIEGTDVQSILVQGKIWCDHSNNYFFSTDLLGFFCVAMNKKLYDDLSGLDENFGLGFYEDTDFCYRAHMAGKNMMITEDVFIYHQGSATFSKLPQKTKQLMRNNRKLFKKKHGRLPVTSHVREKNLLVLKGYEDYLNSHGTNQGICYKASNRLEIAAQLQPNNPIKRFWYNKKLKPLQQYFHRANYS
jgi:GT2 family glycosyltransferase